MENEDLVLGVLVNRHGRAVVAEAGGRAVAAPVALRAARAAEVLRERGVVDLGGGGPNLGSLVGERLDLRLGAEQRQIVARLVELRFRDEELLRLVVHEPPILQPLRDVVGRRRQHAGVERHERANPLARRQVRPERHVREVVQRRRVAEREPPRGAFLVVWAHRGVGVAPVPSAQRRAT